MNARKGHLHLIGCAMVAMGLALSTPAFAAEQALRVAQREGYGRIVFDWGSPIRYAAEVVGGQLVMQFETPITDNIAPITQTLGAYVSTGRISTDRRTLTYPLRANVTMRTFTVGTAIVVDLSGPTPTAAAATAPRPAAQPSAQATGSAAPRSTPPQPPLTGALNVRTGIHPNFFRVVFDWPTRTGYRIERGENGATITFDRSAPIDAAALNRSLPAASRGTTTTTQDGSTVVTIPLAAGAQVRDFTNANSIVIDLYNAGAVPPPATAAAPPQTASTGPRDAASPPEAPAAPAAQASGRPAPPATRAPQGSAAAAAALAGQPTEQTAVDASGRRVTRGAGTDPANVDPLSTRPAEISLTIPWTEPAAAAVFRRAGYLWVVFDRPTTVDVAAMAKAGAPYVSYVEQLPYRNNTILRMVTAPDINPSVRRNGLDWVLDFRSLPLRPTRAIEVRPQLERADPNIFLPITEAGRTVAVEDPEVGDFLLVVPVIPLGYGINPARDLTDVELPVTAQGVVVIPKSDGVRAQASRVGIDVDVDGGMALSRAMADQIGAFGEEQGMQRILNIGDWQVGQAVDYVRSKQALQNALGDERPEIRQEARFRLARFEFVNGFYPEVLAITRVMAASDPNVENTAPFRALRGAANLMMRRWQEAADDFNHFSLANEEDTRFWLAAARSKIEDPVSQAEMMIQTGAVVRNYPRLQKIPLALLGAESAIAAGDDFGAQGFLDMIRRESPRPNEQAAIEYLDGKLNQKIGEVQVALSQYQKVQDSTSLYYNVLGTRDALELRYQLGEIPITEMIDGLEKLRYRWRGDDLELDILLRLADLYSEQTDYGTALRTLKITTSYFRDYPRVDEAAEKMSNIFRELYLNGSADKMSPVTAIALFDEFRSLVPAGEDGDEMIRRLADRLVQVDLLDQAAILLERQVQFRVTGVERARIGARLALVYLLNREPQKAIDVLRDTQSLEASRELNAQRRRLEARALTDLDRSDDAVLLLGADTTDESRQLRAEIYWRAQDWANAAVAIADMVPEPDGHTFNDGESRLVLDWATALTLANDDRTVSRVRQRYLSSMTNTGYYNAFNLITTPRERGPMDMAAVRQQIEQAENFKSFMVDYKDMIGGKPLSAIN